MSDAALVSKSFALKFLRKAFVGARIQKVDTPDHCIPKGASPDDVIETWQVWNFFRGKKQGIIEVTAPRHVLPFAVVREAFRCRLHMTVTAVPLKGGGVRLQAAPEEGMEKLREKIASAVKANQLVSDVAESVGEPAPIDYATPSPTAG